MSGEILDFKSLIIWRKAIAFAKEIYVVSRKFPKSEQFGLTSQLQRASVSISSNIAEGHSRQGKEFANFLSIARGSLAEAESQLLLAIELEYINEKDTLTALGLASEIRRMSAALTKKLRIAYANPSFPSKTISTFPTLSHSSPLTPDP